MASFPHDFTNLEAYPVVTICLESMAYWWLLPVLSTVSHKLRAALDTEYYKRAARMAFITRTAARMFRLRGEQYRFKMIFIKHLWTIWNKPGNGDPISSRLAVLTSAYKRVNSYRTVSKELVKTLGLSLLGWDPTFNLLVRIAMWMHHFGMADSALYTVFVARMDLLYMELAKSYPYQLNQRQARFSKYIQAMCRAPSHQLWVWSITQRPRNCSHYNEMHALWSYGPRRLLEHHVQCLPCYVQSLMVLMCCYMELHKRRGHYLPGKVGMMCTLSQAWLDAGEDDVILID